MLADREIFFGNPADDDFDEDFGDEWLDYEFYAGQPEDGDAPIFDEEDALMMQTDWVGPSGETWNIVFYGEND